MNIVLQNGDLLSGDMLISAVLRTDLTPIPASLELTVRGSSVVESQVVEGHTITSSISSLVFRIIKVEKSTRFAGAQGGDVYPPITVTALYDPCHKIAFRRKTAVVKENVSLGAIYSACGASARIGSDFPIKRFTCLVGSVPSFYIASALQEEGGVLVLDAGKLKFVRLHDLFKSATSIVLQEDIAEEISSGFLERNEVPSFYSLDAQGRFVFGNRSKERVVKYQPRSDVRVLTNMTRALIKKRIARIDYAPQINAGNIIQVGDVKFVAVTAAHCYASGTDGDGIDSYSKFWLAEIEE